MKRIVSSILPVILVFVGVVAFAQNDTLFGESDSTNRAVLDEYHQKLAEAEQQRVTDSLKKAELETQLDRLKTADNLEKQNLLQQLKKIEENEQQRVADRKLHRDSLLATAKGFPVMGFENDTLFLIYTKIGASTPQERAATINQKIERLYEDDFLKTDSILVAVSGNTFDIIYKDMIVMSVSETDALFYGKTISETASHFRNVISGSIAEARNDNFLLKLLSRIGLVLLVIIVVWFFIWLIGKGYSRFLRFINDNKKRWLKDFSYKDYTFITADQELQIILFLVKIFRWFIYVLLLYITLPIIFSIFPFSRTWADTLLQLIWSPFKSVLVAVWNYIPKLFTILVIYFVMKYVIRFVGYIFREIETEKLKIAGFHADWAMPTYSIVKFLLYAFTFVLIFPSLPGSDSDIFKGVSVFIGILFSLGSSSAISNMIAGLVITYMRPFKIGERIKIGDVAGDVIEKTLLVTRVRTIKNEIITIPNSSVLTGNTTNYSTEAKEKGLIVHTTVTIGYDVPWPKVHEALIAAALQTELIVDEPKPFVLQTSLDDFYVSYQLNAYTREASKQAIVYSNLHQNIQDVCNERGIEIMSPHYRAARDGNATTIPSDYLPKDYRSPSFKVKVDKKSESET